MSSSNIYLPVFRMSPQVPLFMSSLINALSQSSRSPEVTPVVMMSSPPFKNVDVDISSDMYTQLTMFSIPFPPDIRLRLYFRLGQRYGTSACAYSYNLRNRFRGKWICGSHQSGKWRQEVTQMQCHRGKGIHRGSGLHEDHAKACACSSWI